MIDVCQSAPSHRLKRAFVLECQQEVAITGLLHLAGQFLFLALLFQHRLLALLLSGGGGGMIRRREPSGFNSRIGCREQAGIGRSEEIARPSTSVQL